MDRHGENAIVLCPGANACVATADVDTVLVRRAIAGAPAAGPRPVLLLQNEINAGAYALERGAELGTCGAGFADETRVR